MGLENLHRQNREFGNKKKWLVFKGGMKLRRGGGGVGYWPDEGSAKRGIIRGDGERPLSTLDPTFS